MTGAVKIPLHRGIIAFHFNQGAVKEMSNKNNKIYFIKAENGLVKIGKSNKPLKRLGSLQTGSPIKLKIVKTVFGGIYLESLIHCYFSECRKHGEWFRPDYELRAFLDNKKRITITGLIDYYKMKHKHVKRGMKRYFETLEYRRLYL